MNEDELRSLVGELTVAEKARLVTGADFWTLHPEPKVGLRRLVLSDGPNGVRGTTWDERDTSLLLPVASGLAATWDRDAVTRAGELFGDEAVRRGVHVVLAPTINLHRSPFGGRHFENFSEDPLLTGVLGARIVAGIQSRGVAATPKHYVGNESETERFTYDAVIDERTLRDCYLEPFRRIVAEASPWAMMAAYNSVNGHTMTEHSLLVNEVLKGEWGFDGVLVSDWFATRTCAPAANGGLDLAMPGPKSPWAEGALAEAVQDGEVAEEVLDDKVLRLLRLADRVGALGEEERSAPVNDGPPEQARAVIRDLTARGFVLLRNEKALLPLDPGIAKIAVIGENATFPAVQGGGSSHVSPPHVVTPLEGLRKALPNAEIQHRRGVRHRRLLDPIPREEILDPQGEGSGLRVEYLGENDEVLSSELRGAERLIWQLGAMPEGTRKLRMSGSLSLELGEHVFGVNGTGHFRVEISGREVLTTDVAAEGEADDPLGDMLAPPEQRFNVVLVDSDVDGKGRACLTVEFTPQKIDADLIAVGLGHRAEGWDDATELEAALRAARDCDVAVVVVGTNDEVETEGRDRGSLDLPGQQDELVAQVVAINPNTVVVVNVGGPVLMPWSSDAPAVLWTWFGGQEYGDALADVLLGAVEPGGRLPTTLPARLADVPVPLPGVQPVDGALRYSEGPLIGYRAYENRGVTPGFCFGHGLGYTSWSYDEASRDGDAVVVKLRNTGDHAGREVVQVYADDPVRLVGFAVVTAESGAEAEVTVPVEPCDGDLRVGRSAGDLRLDVVPGSDQP
ncbi:glycoside hydrolase family 3 C-terminal domain-containing protein [Saccharopolyspora sp. TS4A08]|uniref:Glycoside hydrolase family 3 C-terminal domain-containing protein n=1 Tax=Saccharopolyspora ipomoeae TaxID=3042027 RepID=A0ABT6PY22_9PSEU|nr:glycoside hydrolase family 3 C-terminal domain-containing protein [Saccharopolyspora sp. TS4A08]MDI2032913.1 glycoside hydrolase family 3 C-terminal domain-containing protein [Saccharopolyspora sp. TS4A08]